MSTNIESGVFSLTTGPLNTDKAMAVAVILNALRLMRSDARAQRQSVFAVEEGAR